jgi:small subunit ribosomal protein S2
MEIPIVSICDTNCDPDLIDYPMPGNDDAIRSVRLFCKLVADSVIEGRESSKPPAGAAGEIPADLEIDLTEGGDPQEKETAGATAPTGK